MKFIKIRGLNLCSIFYYIKTKKLVHIYSPSSHLPKLQDSPTLSTVQITTLT